MTAMFLYVLRRTRRVILQRYPLILSKGVLTLPMYLSFSLALSLCGAFYFPLLLS